MNNKKYKKQTNNIRSELLSLIDSNDGLLVNLEALESFAYALPESKPISPKHTGRIIANMMTDIICQTHQLRELADQL